MASCSVQQHSEDSGETGDEGFLNLEAPNQEQSRQGNEGSREVHDRLPGENYRRSAGRSRCGCGGASNKGFELRIIAMRYEPRPGDFDSKIDGQEVAIEATVAPTTPVTK